MPVRSRGKLIMAAVAGLLLVGSIGAWALGGFGGETADGAPPVIKAESGTPIKVVPEAKPVARAKESYDRVDPNATATVVASAEEPGEKPTPRVILPGASSTSTEARVAGNASPQLAPSEPVTDTNMGRRVRTIAIRPDGSMAAPASEPSPSAQALVDPNPAPPAPIQGIGSAEGMSMQPGTEFGIMASEQPPQTASAQQDVPVPQPRPLLPQDNYTASAPQAPAPARAATEVPAPRSTAGGPPSTPQPQVTLTNKRPLKPTGAPAPGPGAQNRPAAAPLAPARPVATVPVAPAPSQPRQIAMAAPTAPAAPAAARPAPAAPQVAAVSGASGAFGVQLTAQRSEAEAMAAFNALKQRYPQVLGAYSATVARADLGAERGVFYRAMVPAQSQSDASNLCIQFKASGVDCIVQRR